MPRGRWPTGIVVSTASVLPSITVRSLLSSLVTKIRWVPAAPAACASESPTRQNTSFRLFINVSIGRWGSFAAGGHAQRVERVIRRRDTPHRRLADDLAVLDQQQG